jgi:hypothetical protein
MILKDLKNEVTRFINDITKLDFDLGLKEIEKCDLQDLLQSTLHQCLSKKG